MLEKFDHVIIERELTQFGGIITPVVKSSIMNNHSEQCLEITFRPIGVVHSPYIECEGTPIQGKFSPEQEAMVEIFPQYSQGLEGLEGFTHIYLLYHFHLSTGYRLITAPFLDDNPRGVFSIRAPNRPNPIGLSVVRLIKIENNILTIGEVDLLEGTPVLDIKPYIPEFDCRPEASSGWVKGKVKENRERQFADSRFKLE